jgi:hypothetical protein
MLIHPYWPPVNAKEKDPETQRRPRELEAGDVDPSLLAVGKRPNTTIP